MKIRTAILVAGFFACPALHAQVPGTTPATPPVGGSGSAAPAADPFVRQPPDAPPGGVEEDWSPRHLSVCVESFSVDLADAAELHRTISNDQELYKVILERVGKGTATQESFSVICARSGEKSAVESVSEISYPTKYDRHIDPTFGNTVAKNAGGGQTKEVVAAADVLGPLVPTEFNTRGAGTIVEIEPTLGQNNDIIDLRISTEMSAQVDFTKWGKGDGELETPAYENQRVMMALTLRPKTPMLMGTPSRPPKSKIDPAAAKKVWFSFVTVNVIKV
jgi:hypothetical protein